MLACLAANLRFRGPPDGPRNWQALRACINRTGIKQTAEADTRTPNRGASQTKSSEDLLENLCHDSCQHDLENRSPQVSPFHRISLLPLQVLSVQKVAIDYQRLTSSG